MSTINKSIVNNLRLVDPEAKTIKITCAVVEEEGKIRETDSEDVEKYTVKLKGAIRPRGKKRLSKPELQWLDESTGAYYHHLVNQQNYDVIIGHAPYLANGCLNLKDLYKEREVSPKVILMFHGLPKDENGDVEDEMVSDWLNEADVIFSVGKAVESELLPYVAGMDEEMRPIHKIYIPSYPTGTFLCCARTERKGSCRNSESYNYEWRNQRLGRNRTRFSFGCECYNRSCGTHPGL